MVVSEELRIIITGENKTGGALKSVGGALGNIGKVALGVAAGGLAVVGGGIALIASKAIPAASNLNEALNAVDVVFEDSGSIIKEWGKTAADVAGLSQADFAQMAAQTGAMLINFGLDAKTAADETVNLAQRAADMASIFNTDVDVALQAIQAGLRGEADPLEKFGVSMSAVAVKAKAMELGLADATGELDNAALTQARLALLFEQTDKIAGDFVNTSDQLANASRVQKARWENFMASIGSKFLPIVERFQGIFMEIAQQVMPLVEKALENVMPGIERFADFLAELIQVIVEFGFGSSEFGEVLESMFGAGIADTIMGVIDAFRSLSEAIIPFIQEHGLQLAKIIGIIVAGLAAFSVITSVIGFISGLIATIAGLAGAFAAAGGGIAGIIAILGGPLTLIIAAVVAVVALLALAWKNNWGDIQGKTKAVVAFIKNLVSNFLGALRAFWDEHGERIIEIAQNMWDNVKAIIDWFIGIVQEIFAAFQLAFAGDWEGFGTKLREIWDKVWNDIKEALSAAWETIKTVVGEGIAAIIKWFNDTDWLQVGKDILQGIADGISAGTQWVIDAVRSVAGSIWSTLVGFFRGGSPSMLMAEFGADLMKGWAIGIGANSNLPATAMAGAGAGVFNSASNVTNFSRSDNIFIQNSAQSAFLLQRQQETEFDDINRVI